MAKKNIQMDKATRDYVYQMKHHPEQLEQEKVELTKRHLGYDVMHNDLDNSDTQLKTLGQLRSARHELHNDDTKEQWESLGVPYRDDEAVTRLHNANLQEYNKRTDLLLTQKHGSVEKGMEHYRSLGEQKGNEVIKQLSLKGLTHCTRLRGNGRWNFVETAPNKYDLAEHMTPKEISEIDKHEKSYYHHRNLSKQQFKGSEAGEQLALF